MAETFESHMKHHTKIRKRERKIMVLFFYSRFINTERSTIHYIHHLAEIILLASIAESCFGWAKETEHSRKNINYLSSMQNLWIYSLPHLISPLKLWYSLARDSGPVSWHVWCNGFGIIFICFVCINARIMYGRTNVLLSKEDKGVV